MKKSPRLHSLPSLQMEAYKKLGLTVSQSTQCIESLFDRGIISEWRIESEHETDGISVTNDAHGFELSDAEARVLDLIKDRNKAVAIALEAKTFSKKSGTNKFKKCSL